MTPASWWRPDWPAPAGVQAVCTTRAGGVSAAPYDTFNLGDHVGDRPHCVAQNRRRLAQAIGARAVFLRQVHGTRVVELNHASADGLTADASCTAERDLACTIMVADCLPVLLCDRSGRRVAAAHAGWRGLLGGVLEQAVGAFEAAGEVLAWLGPCIGPAAYEVGAEVRDAFVAADARAASCFRAGAQPGKWWADLPALARQRLGALGLQAIHGNDGGTRWCTVAQASAFFSHRRDGVCGRFAAAIWIGG